MIRLLISFSSISDNFSAKFAKKDFKGSFDES